MKKMIGVLLSLALLFSLAACGNEVRDTGAGSTSGAEEHSAQSTVPAGPEESTGTASADDAAQTDDAKGAESPESLPEDVQAPVQPVSASETRVLVAYFSATNQTKGIAQYLAAGLGADLYEITPEEPYTDADLNYGDNTSRTSIEMNDPDARPAISGIVENLEQYDTVFLGYPIWWGKAPRIISTFLESGDFAGKTIVPFCTSGSSGIGSSATDLESLAPGAVWMAGRRFSGSDPADTVMEWANGLELFFGN